MEVTEIAQDLARAELERRLRGHTHAPEPDAHPTAAPGNHADTAAATGGPGSGGAEREYDKAPRPAYEAAVLFRHPPAKAAPLSDGELVDLCFPHK